MAIQERMKGGEDVELIMKRDFLWSVQPLIILFSYLGVDLLKANQKGICQWFLLHRLLCLMLSISNQVFSLFYVFRNVKQISGEYIRESGFNSNAFAWNAAIDYVNYAFHNVGSHFVLLCVVRTRWGALTKSFQRLEPFSNGNNGVTTLRKISISAIVYVITVVC